MSYGDADNIIYGSRPYKQLYAYTFILSKYINIYICFIYFFFFTETSYSFIPSSNHVDLVSLFQGVLLVVNSGHSLF